MGTDRVFFQRASCEIRNVPARRLDQASFTAAPRRMCFLAYVFGRRISKSSAASVREHEVKSMILQEFALIFCFRLAGGKKPLAQESSFIAGMARTSN